MEKELFFVNENGQMEIDFEALSDACSPLFSYHIQRELKNGFEVIHVNDLGFMVTVTLKNADTFMLCSWSNGRQVYESVVVPTQAFKSMCLSMGVEI